MITSMLLLKILFSVLVAFGIIILEYIISEFIQESFGIESHLMALVIAFGLTLVCFFILFVN